MINITINNGALKTASVNKVGGGVTTPINYWVDNTIIDDDGYYNGFPMIADAIGISTVGMFKKAAGHAPGGPMTFIKTDDGGVSWTKTQVNVDGIPLISLNYSFIRLLSGRMLICYRTEYTDGDITWAYSNDGTHNFISTQVERLDTVDYTAYHSPNKMIETSYGTVLIVFYRYPTPSSSAPTEGIIYESTDQGLTWTYKSTIFSHNSAVSNPTIGDWKATEVAICETHPTGVESTSKFIAIARTLVADIGGTFPQHFTSSDGGNTWTIDLINKDVGSYVDDNGVTISSGPGGFSRHVLYAFIGTNSPFDIRLHNGFVYVVNGERNRIGSNKYALKWIKATPDGAYQNSFGSWTRPVQVGPYYNAITLGASVDCGYPTIFKAKGVLYVAQYDTSTLPSDPLKADTREFVEIQRLF